MADLNSTIVRGSLSSMGIYENGTSIDDKFATTLAINGNKLSLLNANGGELSSATIPTGSVGTPSITFSGTEFSNPVSTPTACPSLAISSSVVITPGYITQTSQATTSVFYLPSLTLKYGKTFTVNNNGTLKIPKNTDTVTYLDHWIISQNSSVLTFSYR